MLAIDEHLAIRGAHLPDLLAKKIPFHRQLPDLGVQLLDLALAQHLAIIANTRIEGTCRLLKQLLLPRIIWLG